MKQTMEYQVEAEQRRWRYPFLLFLPSHQELNKPRNAMKGQHPLVATGPSSMQSCCVYLSIQAEFMKDLWYRQHSGDLASLFNLGTSNQPDYITRVGGLKMTMPEGPSARAAD
jgi:hypothetical protein